MGITKRCPAEARDSDKEYAVIQVTLKEKFLGTGSGNVSEFEGEINNQAAKGFHLHAMVEKTS